MMVGDSFRRVLICFTEIMMVSSTAKMPSLLGVHKAILFGNLAVYSHSAHRHWAGPHGEIGHRTFAKRPHIIKLYNQGGGVS